MSADVTARRSLPEGDTGTQAHVVRPNSNGLEALLMLAFDVVPPGVRRRRDFLETSDKAIGGTPVGGPRHGRHAARSASSGLRAPRATAAGVYVLAALVVTARLWVHPAHRMVAGNPHDTDLYTWWLAWIAHQLSGGHFSLITHAMNAPTGVNAMWNTSLLLPGIVLSPLTLLAGGQASYNVLLLVGFAGSAYTAHRLLLRHANVEWWPALAGGAVYGFSPAMMHASIGHVSLVFAPLVPLLVSATLDICTGRVKPVVGGFRLGALASAQLLTGEELLFDTAFLTGLLLVSIAIFCPAAALRALRALGLAVWAAVAVVLTIAGYPLWFQLYGPLAQHGSPLLQDYTKIDLSELVTPSQIMLLHTHHSAVTALAIAPNKEEYLGYLGWPLLVFLVIATIMLWRNLPARVAAITAGASILFSLGEHLKFHGHQTHVPMPWELAMHLPLANDVAVARFALFTPLAAAGVVAIALTQLQTYRLTATCVALAVIVPLVPIPFSSANVATAPPAVVSALKEVRPGSTVLVLPFPDANFTDPMRWQGDTDFRFAMPGGYFIGPAWDGRGYIGGDVARASTTLLRQIADGSHSPEISTAERQTLKGDFAYWHVNAVLLGPGRGNAALSQALTGALGPPQFADGDTLMWPLKSSAA
jgi:hypothetical protein